jgi:hypothetical protein
MTKRDSSTPPKKRRKAAQGKWYPAPALVRKRIAEMTRAFESCFPTRTLPNNGLGRKWAKYMMRTKRLYPSPNDHRWLESWCPWMDQSGRDKLLAYRGHWYSTGSLGEHLEIDNAMRKDLRLWTMRPNDVEWQQVQSEMKGGQYVKKQAKRHANGVKARRKDTAEPWKALGMRRTKYYRLGLHRSPMVTDETNGTPESRVSPYVVRRGTLTSHFRRPEAALSLPLPSQPHVPALAGSELSGLLVWTLPSPAKVWRMRSSQRRYACRVEPANEDRPALAMAA